MSAVKLLAAIALMAAANPPEPEKKVSLNQAIEICRTTFFVNAEKGKAMFNALPQEYKGPTAAVCTGYHAGAQDMLDALKNRPKLHNTAVQEHQPGADSYFTAVEIDQPPPNRRGNAVAGMVVFGDQKIVDSYCGGNNQIIACAGVNDRWIVLPNPCQARFAGEGYAALVCHEKGHNLGWTSLHERIGP